MADKKDKMSKQDFIRYILNTPVEEILESSDVEFLGATEKEKAVSMSRFIRLRGLFLRGSQAQIMTPDDSEILVIFMKTCIGPTNPQE